MKKIIDHLRLEWYKYFLEILVITMGILGAFALNNWKEEIDTAKERKSIYKRLISDLEKDKEQMMKLNEYLTKADSAFTEIIQNKRTSDQDLFKAFLFSVEQIPEKYYQTFFELFRSSGKIELIDAEIASEIQTLYSSYRENSNFFEQRRDKTHDEIRPLVLGLQDDEELRADYMQIVPPNPKSIRRIMQNPNYRRAIIHQQIMGLNILNVNQEGIDKVDVIIEKIENKL